MKGEIFIFPVTNGTIKLSGGYQDVRPSTWSGTDRGEEQDNLPGGPVGSSSISQQDSSWYDCEANDDSRSMTEDFIYCHHVEHRVNLYVPREESFLIPLKYIAVTRNTDTTLGVICEKILKIIGTSLEIENCQTRGLISKYSPYWVKKNKGWTNMVRVRLTRKQTTSRPDYGQKCGKFVRRIKMSRNKSGPSRNQSSMMPETYVVFTW